MFCAARGTADWFGVSKDGDATQRWQRKSLRHCSLRYGKLKPQVIREMDLPSQDNISLTSTETPPPLYVPSSQHGMQKVTQGGGTPRLMIDGSICISRLQPKLFFLSVNADRGPAGTRPSLPHGGGGGRLQRASDAHHARRRLALLLYQLPLRSQPAAAPPQEGVGGQDELQGGSGARQGVRDETRRGECPVTP